MNVVQKPEASETFLGFDPATGSLKIVSADASAGFDFELDGRPAGPHFPGAAHAAASRINRIIDCGLAEAELLWRTDGEALAVAKNINADWTIDGGNTAYFSSTASDSEQPVCAYFSCPIEGQAVTVTPGQSYAFEALFGLHRCSGSARIVFLDGEKAELQRAETIIPDGYKGGRRAEGYCRVLVSARAPAKARFARIEINKGVTAEGGDSYLFFTHPAFYRANGPGHVDHHDAGLPVPMVIDLFAGSDNRTAIYDACAPGEALDGGIHSLVATNRATGTRSNVVSVSLPTAMAFKMQIHGLEGSTLIGRLETPPGWKADVGLSLWIDGEPIDGLFPSKPGAQQVRMPLPTVYCDGRPHVFDVRLGASGRSIGQYAAIGPVNITPWDALQKYSGMPLPAQIAPLAAYRYLSLAARQHEAAGAAGIKLQDLHDILLEGFETPRREFAPLPFPKVDAPDVSIVIPVHNKFDVTYYCLAALLFAATKASFEVIVVDDGSKDTTKLLPDIAPGVVYVRNDKALGFVGACNAGAEKARGKYIVFLNNDTEPTAHWLDELLFVFDNYDGVGLAGSKLIYPDGPLQEAGGIVWETGDPWNYGRRQNAADPRYSYTRQCDYVSGAAIMLPRSLWTELGGFSKEFAPAYFEDTDLAFKVKNAGKKVVFVPQSVVVHYEGLSNGTDQTASSGLKRFQEINRPKFKQKWSALFSGNGKVGKDVDLNKDRGVVKRVLFFDLEFPRVDHHAGSYAAIQEIRMFQALGCKVTFAPINMAFLGRHTTNLQRLGVETIHIPFYPDIATFLRERGPEFDLIYITRYGVADNVHGLISTYAPHARVVINVADLHFLRQIRDAAAENNPAALDAALLTRHAEVTALGRSELVLSYSATEQAVITSHVVKGPKTGIVPWVVDPLPVTVPFKKRKDVAFLGGFGHSPNKAAVKFFADEVMPLLRTMVPGIRFLVYGSFVPPEIEALGSSDVIIKGYVKEVSEIFDTCRVFVAPLLSGAGMKGKVLDCISAGIPSVLSPIAVEGIAMRDGLDTMVANAPREWAEAVAKLYTDEKAWNEMSKNVQDLARTRYSFENGVAGLKQALGSIEFYLTGDKPALHVNKARPTAPDAAAADAGGKLVAALRPQ